TSLFFFRLIRPPRRPPLFPYTTLFRSRGLSLTAGYNMHVPKPVDPGEFTAIIASVAQRGSAASQVIPAGAVVTPIYSRRHARRAAAHDLRALPVDLLRGRPRGPLRRARRRRASLAGAR